MLGVARPVRGLQRLALALAGTLTLLWAAVLPASAEQPLAGSGSGDSGPPGALPLVVVAGALVAAALLALVRSRRRRRDRPGEPGGGREGGAPAAARSSADVPGPGASSGRAPESIRALRERAATALIETDDSTRTSEQELAFAIAQLGEDAAAPFRDALAQAKGLTGEAFGLHHQALGIALQASDRAGDAARDESSSPEMPGERTLLERVIDLCRQADASLDEQVGAFDAQRDLQGRVHDVLPGLGERIAATGLQLEAASQSLAALSQAHPAAALQAGQQNLAAARPRVAFARRAVGAGEELLIQGDRAGAATHVRAAEEAIAQAEALLAALERLPQELESASRQIYSVMAELARDLEEAERLGVPAQRPELHRYVMQTLHWARDAIDTGRSDPIATLRGLTESDTALEQALVPLRDAAVARERAVALLPGALSSADISVRAAADFVGTRRGAVGAPARTALAQSEQELIAAQAMAGSDALAALGRAQQADRLADQALALAQQDEARARNDQARSGGLGSIGEMILGGILIDAMTNRGPSAWGSPGGSSGGGGQVSGGGGGWQGHGPSSFGGGGGGGRHSGGGRF